jgi:general secretion pathway protein I
VPVSDLPLLRAVWRSASRQRAFTLVEVLAALVIVSLGMLGVIQAVSGTANSGAYLRQRTIAHWIAMNRVTEVRLEAKAPDVGKSEDEVEMAGRKWRWNMEVMQTQVESIRRIDVTVAPADAPDDEVLAQVSGFYGTALDQPGSTAMIWPGGEPTDGAGPNPGDPSAPQDPNAPPTDPSREPEPQPPSDPVSEPNPTPDPGGDPGSTPQ